MSAPRPYIHVNLALDEQGRTTGSDGRALSISCADDWRRVHLLRERYSAIGIGCRTWKFDQPQLTARAERLGRPPTRQPARVIFCSGQHCALPVDERPTYYVGAQPEKAANIHHIFAAGRELTAPLRALAAMGIRDMLVEGGLILLGSFFRDGCVDRCSVFVGSADFAVARAALSRCTGLPSRLAQLEPARWGRGTLFDTDSMNLRDLWGAPHDGDG